MKPRILIVDDDETIREIVRLYVEKEGYVTVQASDGVQALNLLESQSFQCAVIDIMMPHLDGWELCREIKQYYKMPVLMLTARSEAEEKIRGFQLGADDYLTKPFHPVELVMRVKSLLRRYDAISGERIMLGNAVLDSSKYQVIFGSTAVDLPVKQFELLFTLCTNPGKIFTRDYLIEKIWGLDYEGDDRTVDTHIKRIRKQLDGFEQEFKITTVRGLGYKVEIAP